MTSGPAPDADLRRIARLVEELQSDDAFERRDAIESLARLTHLRLGYEWGASEDERARAIARWRQWIEAETERRQGQEVQATIQALAQGHVDPEALKHLLKTLPDEQKKALLAQLVIAKAAAESSHGPPHAPCGRCAKRPATVQVTSLRPDGSWTHDALCEICAGKSGV